MRIHIMAMKYFGIFTLLFFISEYVVNDVCASSSDEPLNQDPEASMNITEIIRYDGYPVNEYTVTTDDGYELYLHQIPYGKNNSDSQEPRKPVLILHGIFEVSTIWVIDVPDKDLAYLLAEAGYDVWLGNFRGNELGCRHVTLSPKEKEFWMFSFDQMVDYDLPNIIDFVLGKTGFEELHYIGHSLGTTVGFAMLSKHTGYNKKIRSFQALAPTAEVGHIESPFFAIPKAIAPEFDAILNLVGDYQLLGNSTYFDYFTSIFCTLPTEPLCANTMFLIMGYDPKQFNNSRTATYLTTIPAGASTQTFYQILQCSRAERFQAFDFGAEENQKKYNSTVPPLYNMSNIEAAVYLYWGPGDTIAVPEDVAIIASRLKNLALNYRVNFDDFSHMDFLWALDVIKLLYNQLLESLKNAW